MAVVEAEKKSTIGLDSVHLAQVSADDAAAYTSGTPEILAPAVSAKVTNKSESQVQYADDGVFDSSASEGESEIVLEFTSIPMQILAKMLGKTYIDASGMLIDGDGGEKPEFALSFRAMKSNGKYRYYQYLKGKFNMPDDEFSTLAERPEPKNVSVTYIASKTIHGFKTKADFTERVKRVIVDEDSTGAVVTGWFTAVKTPPVVA